MKSEFRQETTRRLEDARRTNADRMRKEREDAELSRKSRLRTVGLHGRLVMQHVPTAALALLPLGMPDDVSGVGDQNVLLAAHRTARLDPPPIGFQIDKKRLVPREVVCGCVLTRRSERHDGVETLVEQINDLS